MPDPFAQLSPEALALLLEQGEEKRWPRGAFLLREGSVARHLHYIRAGALRAFQLKDGKEINLRFYFEESFASDLKSLRGRQPSRQYLQAMESTGTYTFDAVSLRVLYDLSPEIERWGRGLLESLAVAESEHVDFFKLYTPEERYAWLLAHEAGIIQRVSLTRLASYLGITRESLSRIRGRKRL